MFGATLRDFMHDLFIWGIILLLLVYFYGFVQDVTAGGSVLTNLIYAGTARNPQTGQFANYPQ